MKWFTKLDDFIQYIMIMACVGLLFGLGYLLDKLIDKI